MSSSVLQSNQDLDADYGSGTPATLYAALSLSAPNMSAGGGAGSLVEPDSTNYGGYARVPITNNATNFPAAASGAKTNGIAITFPISSGGASAPCTATYLVFMTAASGGQIKDALLIGGGGIVVANTQAANFPAGSVQVTQA